jgi:uncharacterized membrane protein
MDPRVERSAALEWVAVAAGHGHGGGDLHVSGRTARTLTMVAIAGAVVTVISMLWVGFEGEPDARDPSLLVSKVYGAKVVAVETQPCAGTQPEDAVECRNVTYLLTEGPDKGEERTQDLPQTSTSPNLNVGDRVVLNHTPDAEPPFDYSFADRQRRNLLFVLLIAFAVAVVLLGRWHGVGALVGLAFSLLIILRFVLPGILAGHSAVLVAVIGASAIAYLALYLANGLRALTTVALLGTLGALAATTALSALVTALAEFSGFASEETAMLEVLSGRVDVSGLILAGIVLGSLGALDDMTVTQASAVGELAEANPTISRIELFRRSMRIGRDHVASTVNTLALAYAGAALPTLLLFVLSQQSLGTVANSEIIAVEIVRTLVGSIGLVLSVPLTTWLATRLVTVRGPDDA